MKTRNQIPVLIRDFSIINLSSPQQHSLNII